MSHYKGEPDNGPLVEGCAMMTIALFLAFLLYLVWEFGAALRGM